MNAAAYRTIVDPLLPLKGGDAQAKVPLEEDSSLSHLIGMACLFGVSLFGSACTTQ